MPARKLDWLMGLGSKSKCHVSAGKLSSGTSGNSLSINISTYQHLVEFPYGSQFHFTARIAATDLFHFHSSLPESLPTDI